LTTTTQAVTRPSRDPLVVVGIVVTAATAAVASFTGLRGLAIDAGWPKGLAWLLPVTLDTYAMTSARVWLASTTGARRARRFARANAVGAIAASIAGNATYHAAAAGLVHVTFPVVVLVGAVPAAVLGLTAHLHALRTLVDNEDRAESGPKDEPDQRTSVDESGPEDGPETARKVRPRNGARRRPKYRTEDELVAAAREADAKYRAAHNGRPITRDALRVALSIAGPRATELRRQLAAESTESGDRRRDGGDTEVPNREEAQTTA
jgi:hypothetical protein